MNGVVPGVGTHRLARTPGIQVPVTLLVDFACRRHPQIKRGTRLAHRFEQRARGRYHRVQTELVMQAYRVDISIELAGCQDRLQVGGEVEPLFVAGIIKRLDPHAIACEEQFTRLPVPDRERKHPVQPGDRVSAPAGIGVQNHLGIAVRVKPVAARDQVFTQFRVVIYGAVENDGVTFFGLGHRLVAGRRQVDNRETTMSEHNRTVEKLATIVGPASRHLRRHAFRNARIDCLFAETQGAKNTAHNASPERP